MEDKYSQEKMEEMRDRERFLEDSFRMREKELEMRQKELIDELRNKERHLEMIARDREKEQEQRMMEQSEMLRDKERHLEMQARQREKEFEAIQSEQVEELRERERHLDMQSRSREKELESIREEQTEIIRERQSNLEIQASKREKEFSSEIKKKNADLQKKEEKLNILRLELEEEKLRYKEESKDRIEETAANYVQSAIDLLSQNKDKFRKASDVWTVLGSISILVAVVVAVIFAVNGHEKITGLDTLNWPFLIYILFKGLIIVALFGALSRYCFVLGNANMHESIKNSERIHAINFGKFYLESYGVTAKWSDIKDAFEHWNIEGGSAFSNVKHDHLDLKSIESVGSLITSLSKIKESKTNAESQT